MARSRNIKPGFFRNADLLELSFEARLLFIGLWTIADREGRLEDRPKQIKLEIFPADNVDIEACLSSLASIGALVRYEADGKRCIQITNFLKHQNPHKAEQPSTLPDQCGNYAASTQTPKKHSASTVQAPCKDDATTEVAGLIPDSLLLIPDSLTPDSLSLIPETLTLIPEVCDEASPSTPRRKRAAGQPSATSQVWESYSNAYMTRYTVEPVRNAKVNGQLAQFVSRVGAQEAPHIAAWFVGHQNGFYVRNMHSVDSLLRDAEKLRTEWATNRRVTNTEAYMADRTETNRGAFQHLIDQAKAKESTCG